MESPETLDWPVPPLELGFESVVLFELLPPLEFGLLVFELFESFGLLFEEPELGGFSAGGFSFVGFSSTSGFSSISGFGVDGLAGFGVV